MAKKNISEKTWYFYFGFAAMFIIIGFFWVFSYYAKQPEYIIQSAVADMNLQDPIEKPVFPYVGIFLMVFGTVLFLTAKYFYEQKRGIKHVKRTK